MQLGVSHDVAEDEVAEEGVVGESEEGEDGEGDEEDDLSDEGEDGEEDEPGVRLRFFRWGAIGHGGCIPADGIGGRTALGGGREVR